jgi:glycosyltransferase involved in cell wall biosynthesis
VSTDNVTMMDAAGPGEARAGLDRFASHPNPVRVSHLMSDVRPYRVAFYEIISRRPDVDVVVYAGLPNDGQGAPTERPELAVPVVGVKNWFYPRQPLKIIWQTGALRMLRSHADVIVCQEVVSNLSVWALRLLHRRVGKRLVLMGYFYRPKGSGMLGLIRDLLRRFLRRSASALVAYTEQGRAELLSEGVVEDAIFVMWNTLDTGHLMRLAEGIGEQTSARVRRRLDVPMDAVLLAFVGRLRSVKRVEVAIEAVRLLHHRLAVPVVLLVVGDGEERGALETRADGAPVRFVGQTYDDEELAELLSAASLLVMPGSVGLTCVLGFSNGLPIVTTDANATMQTPEFAYVRHDENGVVVDEPRPELFANQIESLLSDEARMQRLATGALETAQSLSMERMVDAYVAATARRID